MSDSLQCSACVHLHLLARQFWLLSLLLLWCLPLPLPLHLLLRTLEESYLDTIQKLTSEVALAQKQLEDSGRAAEVAQEEQVLRPSNPISSSCQFSSSLSGLSLDMHLPCPRASLSLVTSSSHLLTPSCAPPSPPPPSAPPAYFLPPPHRCSTR